MRSGLRIKGQRGHPIVREALIRYARWLRKKYEFPIRVPVYLYPSKTIITMHGEHVTASFFAPFSRDVEPFIRIATGDFPDLVAVRSIDDVLASYIVSLSHELVHYFQWIETGDIHEYKVIQKARKMLLDYALEVDHP